MGKGKFKVKELSRETKVILEILIHEIQKILEKPRGYPFKWAEIRELLNSWIEANDLHPEQAETLTREEFEKRFGIEVKQE